MAYTSASTNRESIVAMMDSILKGLVILAMVGIAGCTNDAPVEGVPFKYEVKNQQELDLVDSAIGVLFDQCTGLSENKGWLDVKEANAIVLDVYPYQERMGWSGSQASLTIQIANPTKYIPIDIHAFGHTCYFAFNEDVTQMAVSKTPCKQLCGMAKSDDVITLSKGQ